METFLPILWFMLVGILFTGYAILDGFDLGVGALHLFAKNDEDRRVFLNAIGPVWDGNEVWLVVGGGALFSAFPEVYATVFSGFYIPFMLLLFALIFRAIAIEFRSKEPWPWWRRTWDISFAIGSVLSALLIGIAMGNIVWGIPLDHHREFTGTFLSLLHPYPLWVGITTIALFYMHGSIYLVMKTHGTLQQQVKRWVKPSIIAFTICFLILNAATVLFVPHARELLAARPLVLLVLLLNLLLVLNVPREIHHGRFFRAFLSSSAAMALLMLLFGMTMFPYMVFSIPDVSASLTIYNAASTTYTLGIMAVMALIGLPLVLTYTITMYRVFQGKVELHEDSY